MTFVLPNFVLGYKQLSSQDNDEDAIDQDEIMLDENDEEIKKRVKRSTSLEKMSYIFLSERSLSTFSYCRQPIEI